MKYKQKFQSDSMWQPDVTVSAICERDGKFLLVEERSKSTGEIVFNQPSGHLEDKETILDAVVRETVEETCCHFEPQHLIGVYRFRAANHKTYIRFTFSGSVSEPLADHQLDPDIIRTHWLSYGEIAQRTDLRSPIVLRCLDDYLAGHRFPLSLVQET